MGFVRLVRIQRENVAGVQVLIFQTKFLTKPDVYYDFILRPTSKVVRYKNAPRLASHGWKTHFKAKHVLRTE